MIFRKVKYHIGQSYCCSEILRHQEVILNSKKLNRMRLNSNSDISKVESC